MHTDKHRSENDIYMSASVFIPRLHAPAWECRPGTKDNSVCIPTEDGGNEITVFHPLPPGEGWGEGKSQVITVGWLRPVSSSIFASEVAMSTNGCITSAVSSNCLSTSDSKYSR